MALIFDKETEQALYQVMHDYPLEPGQALWLGPQSVRILASPNGFQGRLPDKMVLERHEWEESNKQQAERHARQSYRGGKKATKNDKL